MALAKTRLDEFGRFSLGIRRLWGDPIEVYKVMQGIDRRGIQNLYPRIQMSNTRHSFMVTRGKFKDMQDIFFV